MRRIGVAALAALVACATAEPVVPAAPPSFHEVKTLLLVRNAGDRAGRAKDALDGLDESLRARGYTTRVVELGAKRKPEEAALERLFLDLEARAARRERLANRPFGDAGKGAGATVADLGVDAVATFHRLEGRLSLPPAPTDPTLPGGPFSGPSASSLRGPMGAFAVVDRQGHLATFAWGDSSAIDDPSVPVNAAEAIDLVVRTLAGEPLDDR